MVGYFKGKYMEGKLFSSQGTLALLVSAPSSKCPLARAQEHLKYLSGLLVFCNAY